jgi:hypothetical protein
VRRPPIPPLGPLACPTCSSAASSTCTPHAVALSLARGGALAGRRLARGARRDVEGREWPRRRMCTAALPVRRWCGPAPSHPSLPRPRPQRSLRSRGDRRDGLGRSGAATRPPCPFVDGAGRRSPGPRSGRRYRFHGGGVVLGDSVLQRRDAGDHRPGRRSCWRSSPSSVSALVFSPI